MRGLDDTDREILDILLSDGRRPYSDIADAVDLSPPAVSDRIERLQEIGVVRRFTVDLDRTVLHEGVPVLVDLQVRPGRASAVADGLADADPVEHVFTTADGRVVATATVSDGDVGGMLSEAIEMDTIDGYDVDLLSDTAWSPSMAEAEFAPECAECGNTVDTEGESVELDGTLYHFCCSSCQSRFVDHYEDLRDGATS
ncbi:ArsR family transcriptional regulator [Halorientalis sp. IM1011]|uniref:AsnC family transcriptional regulator n=1 Tax=Halorientalis sp. IM1011 TaxID=1932360 RepID=UPI00097CC0C8|nr:AsnC family transcriptional regulator [Halorientalis sp. IM1011]AQL41303.1 ArsR family transcriptional regulator [Halorientalis sp. IM1011]